VDLGGVPRRPPPGVGEGQRRVGPTPHQSQHRDDLVEVDPAVLLRRLPVPLDLRRHRRAQPQPAHHDLLGQLVEAVLERSVEVADRLQQAERNEGRNCRLRGHSGSAGT
jgi:hypothetical protein